ncbi:hypothetical protein T484DRAFT_1618582, partial [Baffinella frigidus]
RQPKPETRNPKHETRNTKHETRNLKPEARNPKPETRNAQPETRNTKPDTRSPNPATLNPEPKTLNPTHSTLRLPPRGQDADEISFDIPSRFPHARVHFRFRFHLFFLLAANLRKWCVSSWWQISESGVCPLGGKFERVVCVSAGGGWATGERVIVPTTQHQAKG